MRQYKFGSALLMTMILVGCGGGGSDVPAKPKFTSQVSFGDSLSDVGSYKVGIVSALSGGQFTINAAGTPTNWTQMTAGKLGLPAPCAAQTGLDNGSGAAPGTPAGTVVPVVNNPACTGYAQGGARVTSPVGIGNKNFPDPGIALTVPVVTQIANHLANTAAAPGGKFTGNEVVFVMAGANDVLVQAGLVGAGAITLPTAIAAIQTAAGELAAAVNTQVIANAAKYVVVVNVPDVASTPEVTSIVDTVAKAQKAGLIDALVTAFNSKLKTDLPESATVLNVDAYTASKDEVANPGKYNLTNVAGTACNLAFGVNPLATATKQGSSLACNASNLNSGVTATSHLFADTVHPTPYGHLLFATYVLQAMTNKGWY